MRPEPSSAISLIRRYNHEQPVVLITGALTGIGRATAIAFAKSGASVVVSGRREDAGKALRSRTALARRRSRIHPGRRAQRRRSPPSRRPDGRALRPPRCRGQQCRHRRPARPDHRPDRRKLRRDVRHQRARHAPEHEARSCAPCRRRARGSIVNISSTYGHEGAAGASVYAGSKHAVEGITKSAALEVAESGMRVNAVAPGPTDTGMLDPLHRHAGEQGGAGGDGSDGAPRPHRRRLPTRSSSSRRTRRHSSPARSSTSMAVRATRPVRARSNSAPGQGAALPRRLLAFLSEHRPLSTLGTSADAAN